MNVISLGAARAASSGLIGLGELLRQTVVEVRMDDSGLNVDGEVRDGGLERVTIERDAYELVVPAP